MKIAIAEYKDKVKAKCALIANALGAETEGIIVEKKKNRIQVFIANEKVFFCGEAFHPSNKLMISARLDGRFGDWSEIHCLLEWNFETMGGWSKQVEFTGYRDGHSGRLLSSNLFFFHKERWRVIGSIHGLQSLRLYLTRWLVRWVLGRSFPW